MDLASIIGIVLGAVMVVFGILWGNGVSALQNFVDVPSIIITLGGSLAGLIASNTLKDFLNNFKGVGLAFKDPKYDNGSTIAKIIELSNVARKEGLLALEEVAQNLDDEFMKKGILLIVDGTEPELVRGILETELMNMDERHRSVAGFFETWAALGPAWGMIGTLIGLVNMLKDLQDSSAIGPSMATALLTTLYGSLIANWFCTPIANKLKEEGKKVLMVAGDTFRAGAIEQLDEWAKRIGVDIVSKENADPVSVMYDGVTKAKDEKYDVVLIDTAGRLQNKVGLMKELEKVNKVIGKLIPNAPHETLLVIDATTGQNGISQAKNFKEITNITGIVLTKLDGTAKGGIVLAIKEETGIPVKYVGLGETKDDLRVFDIEKYIYGLFKGMDE